MEGDTRGDMYNNGNRVEKKLIMKDCLEEIKQRGYKGVISVSTKNGGWTWNMYIGQEGLSKIRQKLNHRLNFMKNKTRHTLLATMTSPWVKC